MPLLHRLAAFVAVTLLLVTTQANGQATGTILSDLWGNAAEPGWGVTVQHQSEVVFLTFFIYRADGTPYWVTGTLTRTTPGNGITFRSVFRVWCSK